MRKPRLRKAIGGAAVSAAFALMMVVAPRSALAATLDPGTYNITANLSMPGQYNPVLTGVTVYATNPNNPFGPTIDENSGLSVSNVVPTTPVSNNATLVVGTDGSYTLIVPTANPIFTLQDLGTNASGLTDIKTERVTATKLLGNTAAWEGNYNQRDSRIHKIAATVADANSAEGSVTYDFKGSEMYAVPLNMSLRPSGDIALQLTVDYSSASSSSSSTAAPALETSRVVVNVPQSAKLEDTGFEQTGVFANKGYELSGTVSATETGRYTAIATLKDGFVWADGATDPKTISWTIGDVPNVQVDAPTAQTGLSYTGQEQTGVAAGEGYELSGDAKATNAGVYTATATLKDGYEWKDGSTEPKTITWTIDKVELKASAVLVQKYDNVHLPTTDEVLSALEFSGFVNGETAETATGYVAPTYLGMKVNMMSGSPYLDEYMKTNPDYELKANTSYFLWFKAGTGGFDNYSLTFSWNDVINNANGKAHHWTNRMYTTMTPEQEPRAVKGLVENGSRQNGIVDGTGNYYSSSNAWSFTSESYDGADKVGDSQYQTEAGTYTSMLKTNTGHFWSDGTWDYRPITWTIAKKIDAPTAATGLTYTGAEQVGVAEGDCYTISGTAKTAKAGTYTVKVTPNDGYVWQDGSSDTKSLTWSIAKAELSARYAGESIAFGATPAGIVEVAGFVNGETAENASGYVAPTVSIPELEANKSYTLTPAGGKADNYEFAKYESGELVVGAAPAPTPDPDDGKGDGKDDGKDDGDKKDDGTSDTDKRDDGKKDDSGKDDTDKKDDIDKKDDADKGGDSDNKGDSQDKGNGNNNGSDDTSDASGSQSASKDVKTTIISVKSTVTSGSGEKTPVLPATGDPAAFVGIIASAGSVFAAAGAWAKRRR